jgi:xylulokinase
VHAFCHAIPGTWHQMGVILSAAASLEWLADVLREQAAHLTAALGSELRGPSHVTFLPYLSGERTPHNDADARGMLFGLGHDSDRAAITQAVLEGVAFAFRDCQAALAAAGTTIGRATAVGGGSRSKLWLEIVATVLGIPIDVPADGDFGGAFGAARLGLMAATGADPRAVATRPPVATTIEPRADLRAPYESAYQRYRRLYPATRELMRR